MNIGDNPISRIDRTHLDQSERKHNVNQIGIKGENIEINADNVYIVNNTYNEPVYNNFYNRFVPYYNSYNCNFYPFWFSFPFFLCYSIPFVPWVPWIFPLVFHW